MNRFHFSRAARPEHLGWLGPACLAVSLYATGSWAGESVKIGALLAHPESYHMRIVTVEGVVREHRLRRGIGKTARIEKCNQAFTVADETGAIHVNYVAACKVGNQEVVILANGNRVTVEANFMWPGGGGDTDSGRPIGHKGFTVISGLSW